MATHLIDLETWPRRDHFRLFQALDQPYFSVTTELDLTEGLDALKASGAPFYLSLVHAMATAANAVEAFRLRIRGEQVVLHDQVDLSFTVPWREELFNFCTVDYHPDRAAFIEGCRPAIAHAEAAEALLLDDAHRDDMLYLSCAPWFSFTGLTHPVDRKRDDAVPRIAWGRVIERDGRRLLSVNVQLHHGLADGRHVAMFLRALEAALAPGEAGEAGQA